MTLEIGMALIEKIALTVMKIKVKKVVSLQDSTLYYYIILI